MGNQGALPVRLTRFFGREAEMAGLAEILQEARLTSVVGAPGCGKTRLAVELAERLAPTCPGGVSFVDLAAVADHQLVPGAVAAGAGAREQHGHPIEDTLVDHLGRSDRALLLWDNCEHLVDEVARLAERIVGSCPLVQVLATSRLPLAVQGEQVWRLHPMDAATAAALFVDRARLASSDFDGGGANELAVGDICRQLDGLPLAIELAAAWTRVLSPVEIARRLQESLSLLTTTLRDVDPRHRTMEATVEWSTRLLEPDDRRLFTRLAVFVGGFDLAAAAAVARVDDVLPGLTRLADNSLVQATPAAGGTRYRLPEPVRQCALAMLEAAGEADDLRRRHGEHFLAVASAGEPRWWRDARPMPALAHFQQYSENFHAALAWAQQQPGDLGLRFCEALAAFWEFSGRMNEARRWLERSIDLGTPDDQLRVSTMIWTSRMTLRQGDHPSTHRWLDLCDPYLPGLTPWWGAVVAIYRALVLLADGDADAAAQQCEHALALCEPAGDAAATARATGLLGWARLVAGDLAEAKRLSHEAQALAESVGNLTVAAHAQNALCICAFIEGDAVQLRHQVLATLGTIDAGGYLEEIEILSFCALLAAAEGRLEAAGRLWGASISRGVHRGSQASQAVVELVMPLVQRRTGPWDPAMGEQVMAEGGRMTIDELRAEALAEPERDPVLSRREREVADLVARGLTNRDIAERLHISRRTVETHVENIRRKLGAASRYEIRPPGWMAKPS